MNNEVLKAIMERRSVRKFLEEPITGEHIEAILTAALFAPSTKGKQERHFIVVKGITEINNLNELAKEATLSAEKEEERRYVTWFEKPTYHLSYHAPLFITVACETGAKKNPMADAGVALENMFLAAHSVGVGSVWINQLTPLSDTPLIRAFLSKAGVPATYRICGSAAFGYPQAVPAPMPRKENIVTVIG